LNRISASISGASARVRLPRGVAADRSKLDRGTPVKSRVGPSSVVEVEIAADRLLRLADAVVGALAVHADGNVVLDQDARKIGAGAIDPAGWREVVCAENRNEYYNNKESDVPHADKAGFLSGDVYCVTNFAVARVVASMLGNTGIATGVGRVRRLAG
jgi:hypothetical protein